MPASTRLVNAAKQITYRVATPRWQRLQRDAGGMLSPLVYRKLYAAVRALPDLDVVEVGGAAGASTVAIAQAMRDAGHHSRLIAVEKCAGGSRSETGSYDDNVAALRRNLERFGVADRVALWPHELTMDSGPEVLALTGSAELAGFVHDADGRLDRDVALFWPHLRGGALVVIDDDEPSPHYRAATERYPDGGIKGVLTHRLLRQLEEWGLFARTGRVRNTVFGLKPPTADMRRYDPDVCARILGDVRAEREAHLARHAT